MGEKATVWEIWGKCRDCKVILKPEMLLSNLDMMISVATERGSCFVDRLLVQLIARKQKLYPKDATDFITFIKKAKLPNNTILVSMDVTSLSTNIPQEEGMTTVCQAYENLYLKDLPIPIKLLREMLCLILQENSFQFQGRNYLQTHGTARAAKMAVAFVNIFMAKMENEILRQSLSKPLVWERYIDDVFSLWNATRDKIARKLYFKGKWFSRLKYQKVK